MPTQRLSQGKLIKMALIECEMTQRDLAKRLGIAVSSLNMKLLGERTFTDHEKNQIAGALGKTVEELFPSDDSECEQNTQAEGYSSI